MEVASTASGGTPSRSDPRNFGGGIPWVKSGEVSQGLITQTDETISQLGLATSSARLMPPGTVLVAMYGATAGEVGTLGVEAATNQAVCCITPGRDLDRDFLLESLRTMKTLLKQRAVGGAQPNLSQSDIRGLELKIPPMAQQQEFSRLVQAAREAEHYVSRQAEALDSLFASLQHRAFRGEL
ncbi:restriction endonuclease subunit S [Microbacterium sp. NPDC076895]|uniref:restriction endonuclease subunit S n=1 Tax=Microbacterium sp. NPDC076895 TaxID=3154957 RepID=UPI00341C89B6